VLAIAGIVGLLFFLRRRKAAAKLEKENPYAPPTYAGQSRARTADGDVHELLSPTDPHEVPGDAVKYRYELESRPAELEGDWRGKK
jgi:hypothetical protein